METCVQICSAAAQHGARKGPSLQDLPSTKVRKKLPVMRIHSGGKEGVFSLVKSKVAASLEHSSCLYDRTFTPTVERFSSSSAAFKTSTHFAVIQRALSDFTHPESSAA